MRRYLTTGGVLASARCWDTWRRRAACPRTGSPRRRSPADKPADGAACPGGSSTGLSRDQQVALATHNEAATDKAAAVGKKPNILIIWGDDIGWYNASCYNHGVMGYQTPNIDRIAREGGLFTDWYGQQSCTAGRSAFITGQSPIRTGLTKVGLPGSPLGLQKEDVTIAELLKPHGYAIGQFGKNHLGDRNEYMPTVHGFDEFLGNLYHLNAEEEPENPDYPKNPEFKKKFGPRGVLHSWATDVDDPTVDPQFGKVGKQKIENTGPLTKKRMETVDEEITDAALQVHRQGPQGRQAVLRLVERHAHAHLDPPATEISRAMTGLGVYPDGMVEHDGQVGQLLKKLDDLGIADDTIVMYSTDNGAEVMTWPDGGTTPFHGEKNTNWEGGWRVPCLIRWPGVIKPGTTYNGVGAHEDMLPTLMAAVGEPDVVDQLKKGLKVGDQTYKVHIDGYNLIPYLKGEIKRVAAQGLPLLERRRRPDRAALRPVEGDVRRATGAREHRRVAGAFREPARSEALQPAQRSLRAGRRVHGLRALARGPRLRARPRPGLRGAVAVELQGVPAAPEAGQLQPRPGDAEATRQQRLRRPPLLRHGLATRAAHGGEGLPRQGRLSVGPV